MDVIEYIYSVTSAEINYNGYRRQKINSRCLAESTFFPLLAMGELVGQIRFFILRKTTTLERKKA